MKKSLDFEIEALQAPWYLRISFATKPVLPAPAPYTVAPMPGVCLPPPPAVPMPSTVSLHVSHFDARTLEALCDEFKKQLFENAGIPLPAVKKGVRP